jgi:hypothetical protein
MDGSGQYCRPCRKAEEKRRAMVNALAASVSREPKKQYYHGLLPGEPPKEVQPHAPGLVKWWDAKHGEWRWVAKRSKPRLEPYRKPRP